MRPVIVKDLTTQQLIAGRGYVTQGLERAIGLLSRNTFHEGEALIIPRCDAIHTWFMRFPIDVLFLRQGVVVKALPAVGPFHVVASSGAETVIELPVGTIQRSGVVVGHRLEWSVLRRELGGKPLDKIATGWV